MKMKTMKTNKMMIALAVCLILLAAGTVWLFGRSVGTAYANAEMYTAGNTAISSPVERLDVEWTAGKVRVVYGEGSGLLLEETGNGAIPEDRQMRWWLDGTTLRVRFEKPGLRLFNFNRGKTLTLTLPKGLELASADIRTVSADMDLAGADAGEMNLASVSGDIAGSVRCGKLNAATTSGDVRLEGENMAECSASTTSGGISLALRDGADKVTAASVSGKVTILAGDVKETKVSTTSGAVRLTVSGSFGDMAVSTVSGDVTAALGAATGFTLNFETTSGSLSSALPLTSEGRTRIYGDGSARFGVRTVSGDVRLEEVE
ncbi:MAG: DUF4097 family beta strand repeat protein [Clostridia bacterium]|nr:DUF4097 family beta strand repeat protein [Clostridia bacterium]